MARLRFAGIQKKNRWQFLCRSVSSWICNEPFLILRNKFWQRKPLSTSGKGSSRRVGRCCYSGEDPTETPFVRPIGERGNCQMGPWVTTWPYKFEEAMFKPGDKVRLKSGGPGMTVEVVGEEAKTILCAWF